MPNNELTREGYERLQAELEQLETVARREIADAILEARGHGDLSENAEYHAAKDEQAHLETRIAKLRNQLLEAKVVDGVRDASGRAGVGSRVTVRYGGDSEELVYQLVGSAEASPADGRLSVESPVGRALVGATAGDEVAVQTPGGTTQLTVVAVGR